MKISTQAATSTSYLLLANSDDGWRTDHPNFQQQQQANSQT